MRLGIVLFFYFYSCALAAQNWQPLGNGMDYTVRTMYTDTIDNILYVGGNFIYADGVLAGGIAKWDGTQFSSMGCGFAWICDSIFWGYPNYVLAITRYKGEIYAGGDFLLADMKLINYIAKWNGITWDSVGISFTNDGHVNALKVINNELYVGGSFKNIGGIAANGLAKWNGTQWQDVNSFPDMLNSNDIKAIEVYKGELYIGGNFQGDSGRQDICKWNGQNWVSVGGGFSDSIGWVNKFYIWKDTLFTAGFFQKSNGNPGDNIVAWDGNAWSDVGGGTMPAHIFDLIAFENWLYVGGYVSKAGGIEVFYIAKWNGIQWCSIGSQFGHIVSAFSVFNNEFYAGGGFWSIDGNSVNYIAKWTGGNYVDTCGVITNINPENQSLPVGINIFPNPSDGKFTVENLPVSGNTKITVYNYTGQKVFEKNIHSFTHSLIDLSAFFNGIYYIMIDSDQKSFNAKIIIQH